MGEVVQFRRRSAPSSDEENGLVGQLRHEAIVLPFDRETLLSSKVAREELEKEEKGVVIELLSIIKGLDDLTYSWATERDPFSIPLITSTMRADVTQCVDILSDYLTSLGKGPPAPFLKKLQELSQKLVLQKETELPDGFLLKGFVGSLATEEFQLCALRMLQGIRTREQVVGYLFDAVPSNERSPGLVRQVHRMLRDALIQGVFPESTKE